MPELVRFRLLVAFPEVVHGISDRTFGSVHPPEDGGRRRLAEALGIPPEAMVSTRQVHRDEVVVVPGPAYGCWRGGYGADGLVTNTPGLYLLGYFADCIPILAYDPVRQVVGLAHAGWRGTILGIARRLVEVMQRTFGTMPGDLYIGLGPSIGPCCYEVGEEVIAGVRAHLPEPETLLRPGRPGHAYFDLWEANRRTLRQAGVPGAQIELSGICTSCRVDRFFSYRREGGLRGLFGAVIGLREDRNR